MTRRGDPLRSYPPSRSFALEVADRYYADRSTGGHRSHIGQRAGGEQASEQRTGSEQDEVVCAIASGTAGTSGRSGTKLILRVLVWASPIAASPWTSSPPASPTSDTASAVAGITTPEIPSHSPSHSGARARSLTASATEWFIRFPSGWLLRGLTATDRLNAVLMLRRRRSMTPASAVDLRPPGRPPDVSALSRSPCYRRSSRSR
jgi:hypothetical protein